MITLYTRRRRLLATVACVAPLASTIASARRAAAQASYPSRPVRIIVPFPAGGATDLLARVVAEKLSEKFGQPFVADNRPGAGGNLGAALAAKSDPDGYTLLMGSPGTQSINAHLYANPGYDGIRDFAPISLVAKAPNLLVVHPSLPVRTLAEFVDYARAHPGLNYGHTSIGGTKHLAGELLRIKTGIEITPVVYRGSAPMVADLLGGHIKVGFDDLLTSLPHVTSGRLRALAITGPSRWPTAAEIPRVSEFGGALADYDVTAWYGLLAPAGTPAAIISRLSEGVIGALNTAELRERLFAQGVEPMGTTADEYRRFILAEHERWGDVIRRAAMRLE